MRSELSEEGRFRLRRKWEKGRRTFEHGGFVFDGIAKVSLEAFAVLGVGHGEGKEAVERQVVAQAHTRRVREKGA
jgi:hypothetical protein